MIFKWTLLCCMCFVHIVGGDYICLIGNDVPSPLDLDTVSICGTHETCFLEQYVTPGGLVRYNAGCRDTQQCGGSTVQDPNLSVCAQCCTGNLCSVGLCGQSGYDPNSGPVCFDCTYDVDQPELCNQITQCNKDQICGSYLNPAGKYTIECMEQVQCDYQKTHSQCVSCCTDAICNTNCTKTNVTAGPDCYDDTNCFTLKTTFLSSNRNICDVALMKHYCNETCGLCPTTTAIPTTPHPCHPSPCGHGVCTPTGTNGHTCTCHTGYLGNSCDMADPCHFQPCINGQCINLPSGAFKCNCDAGHTGLICDVAWTPCSSDPCGSSTRGHCTDMGTTYKCSCNVGFVGTNCEKEIIDCKDIQQTNTPSPTHDDTYLVTFGATARLVKCDMYTDGGGWTILMNRDNANVDFVNKDFSDYAVGFGDIHGGYWIGLEKMHELTHDGRRYQLKIEMTDALGTQYYEIYDDFSVGPRKNFVLHVGSFRGTAGDSLSHHSGFGFSTREVDNDSNPTGSCAQYIQGAWWFHNCYDSCLTCAYVTPGKYDCRSMSWNAYKYCTALRSVRMMVRPM